MGPKLGQSSAPALRLKLGNEGYKEAGTGEAPLQTQSSDDRGLSGVSELPYPALMSRSITHYRLLLQ